MPSDLFKLPLLGISMLGACLWATQTNSKEVEHWQATSFNMLSLLMVFSGCYHLIARNKNNVHIKGPQKGKHLYNKRRNSCPSELSCQLLFCQCWFISYLPNRARSFASAVSLDFLLTLHHRGPALLQRCSKALENLQQILQIHHSKEIGFNTLDISAKTGSLASECLCFLHVCLGMGGVG